MFSIHELKSIGYINLLFVYIKFIQFIHNNQQFIGFYTRW